MRLKIAFIAFLAVGFFSCEQEAKEKSGTKSAIAKESEQNPGNFANTPNTFARSFHTGFDGSTDFSLLLPSFRSYQVEDPSIATVETITVSLSDKTIDELLAEVTKKLPDFPTDRFKGFLGRERTVYKVVPLKAGTTALITSPPTGGPQGGRAGRGRPAGGDVWGTSQQEKIGLVVTSYEPGMVASGQERYSAAGEGNLKACASCHAGGENGAPPHELGRIMEINDQLAHQWITTGKAGGREAKVNHSWEFSSEEQEKGIVAYVRSKQTHDVEALTKLEFEQRFKNFDFKTPPKSND